MGLFDIFSWIFDLFKAAPIEKEEYWDKDQTLKVKADENKLLKVSRNKFRDNIKIFRDCHAMQQKIKKIIGMVGDNQKYHEIYNYLSTLEEILKKIKTAPNVHTEKDTFSTLVNVWRGIASRLQATDLWKVNDIRNEAEDIEKKLADLTKVILGEQNFMLHKLHLLEEEVANTKEEIGESTARAA